MMTQLPTLPTVDSPETLVQHGIRVLMFVHDTGTTATLTDDQLHAADYAYPVAVYGFGHADPFHVRVVDGLADTRRIILAAIRGRDADRKATEQRFVSLFPKSEPTVPPHLVPVVPPVPMLPSGGVSLPYQRNLPADAF